MSLFSTILWLLLGVIGFVIDKKNYFLTYGYTTIGLLHLISYLKLKQGYISITGNILKTHHNPFFNKQINLNEVNKTTNVNGIYTLSTYKEKVKINMSLISEESMQKLNEVIDAINERIKAQNLTQ